MTTVTNNHDQLNNLRALTLEAKQLASGLRAAHELVQLHVEANLQKGMRR